MFNKKNAQIRNLFKDKKNTQIRFETHVLPAVPPLATRIKNPGSLLSLFVIFAEAAVIVSRMGSNTTNATAVYETYLHVFSVRFFFFLTSVFFLCLYCIYHSIAHTQKKKEVTCLNKAGCKPLKSAVKPSFLTMDVAASNMPL